MLCGAAAAYQPLSSLSICPHADIPRTALVPLAWAPRSGRGVGRCAASYALYHQQQSSMQAIARVRFEQEARLFAETLQRRMESHADLLQGMRGLLTVSPQLRRADFERVARELDLQHYHPGVKNINFTRYVPGPRRAAFEEQARSDPHLDGDLPRDSPSIRRPYCPTISWWTTSGPRGATAACKGWRSIPSQPTSKPCAVRAIPAGWSPPRRSSCTRKPSTARASSSACRCLPSRRPDRRGRRAFWGRWA